MSETILDNHTLVELRNKNIINESEVAICAGDLYYAKNVLTNEKRMLDSNTVRSFTANESISESTKAKLLKG